MAWGWRGQPFIIRQNAKRARHFNRNRFLLRKKSSYLERTKWVHLRLDERPISIADLYEGRPNRTEPKRNRSLVPSIRSNPEPSPSLSGEMPCVYADIYDFVHPPSPIRVSLLFSLLLNFFITLPRFDVSSWKCTHTRGTRVMVIMCVRRIRKQKEERKKEEGLEGVKMKKHSKKSSNWMGRKRKRKKVAPVLVHSNLQRLIISKILLSYR